jgi:hypothetical protein
MSGSDAIRLRHMLEAAAEKVLIAAGGSKTAAAGGTARSG